jgi:hypothetical protein
MLSGVSAERRVPKRHPLSAIRALVDDVLDVGQTPLQDVWNAGGSRCDDAPPMANRGGIARAAGRARGILREALPLGRFERDWLKVLREDHARSR